MTAEKRELYLGNSISLRNGLFLYRDKNRYKSSQTKIRAK